MKSKNDGEIIGNYEVVEKEVLTRREVLLMGAMAAGSLVTTLPVRAEQKGAASSIVDLYVAKDFSNLTQLKGLSANQVDQHLKLYKGYVGKINEIDAKLKDVELTGANATYAPLRELLLEQSYALNGVIYHEFYFGNLGGNGGEPEGTIRSGIEERWGSTGKFFDYLKVAGKCMRGWVIVGYNTRDGRLHSYGLDTHNMWVPANVIPVLVLDVYEHAYMIDYGIDRAKYLDAFISNLNWDVVNKRFTAAMKHPSGSLATM